jgi:hypothetical protein
MGLLSDLFLCPADQVDTLSVENSPLVPHDPRVEGVEFKGLTDVQLSMAWAEVEGRPWSIDTHGWETRWNASYDASLSWYPPETTNAFAGLRDENVPLVAHKLAETEDFNSWSEEDLRSLLGDIRALAARADGRILCLWTAL